MKINKNTSNATKTTRNTSNTKNTSNLLLKIQQVMLCIVYKKYPPFMIIQSFIINHYKSSS